MTRPDIITFGCRLNTFESEVMRRHVEGAGLEDTVVVHTCAVTAEAERQARQAIRRVRRDQQYSRIVVTGCSAQIDPGRYLAMSEVDDVVGNEAKLDASVWARLNSENRPEPVRDIMTARQTAHHLVDGFDGRSRAFVQVQNGCDHRCTFCVIPYGRGPNRSVPPRDVIEQVRLLVGRGYREIVVTGVDITSYGQDFSEVVPLGRMLKCILREVPELPRLRLSSIDPAFVDRDLRDLVASEPRLMPHFHLSLQAGDDLVLKRMKRRHSRHDVIQLCADLRDLRDEMVFGADIIAGFPTETEEMHQRSLDIVDEAGLTHLHVFPYSERPGTPASRMPSVPKAVRRVRAAALREAGASVLQRYLHSRIGHTERVLLERSGQGHTEAFAVFAFDEEVAEAPGQIIEAWVEASDDGRLLGRIAA